MAATAPARGTIRIADRKELGDGECQWNVAHLQPQRSHCRPPYLLSTPQRERRLPTDRHHYENESPRLTRDPATYNFFGARAIGAELRTG